MQGGRGMRPALALIAVALTTAVGCGDDAGEGEQAAEADGVGIVVGNSTAQFASCRDWRRGSDEDRYATIEDIRGQLTPQSSETARSDLSDEAAYAIFEKTCASEGTDSLRLYKLYARAQAFAPLTGAPAE